MYPSGRKGEAEVMRNTLDFMQGCDMVESAFPEEQDSAWKLDWTRANPVAGRPLGS